jgi:hypothetical protein
LVLVESANLGVPLLARPAAISGLTNALSNSTAQNPRNYQGILGTEEW